MRWTIRNWPIGGLLLLVAACGQTTVRPPDDAGADAPDAPSTDGGVDGRGPDADAGRVDSGPRADGGPAGVIACGLGTCDAATESCCLGDSIGPHCIPTFGSCGSGVIECDDSEDCEGEEVCCVSFSPGGRFQGVSCRPAVDCAGPAVDVGALGCRTAVDCPGGDLCCPLGYGAGYCAADGTPQCGGRRMEVCTELCVEAPCGGSEFNAPCMVDACLADVADCSPLDLSDISDCTRACNFSCLQSVDCLDDI